MIYLYIWPKFFDKSWMIDENLGFWNFVGKSLGIHQTSGGNKPKKYVYASACAQQAHFWSLFWYKQGNVIIPTVLNRSWINNTYGQFTIQIYK